MRVVPGFDYPSIGVHIQVAAFEANIVGTKVHLGAALDYARLGAKGLEQTHRVRLGHAYQMVQF